MTFLLAVQQRKYHTTIMKIITGLIVLVLLFLPIQVTAAYSYDYQLYKNSENYGIVVFPKKHISKELKHHISSISFLEVESGKAVMRRGTKNENESLMMPLEVQKKHLIKKFIIIQVLNEHEMLVGIYEPQWGLTLPSSSFGLETFKTNIDKTLNVFRGDNPRRKIKLRLKNNPNSKEKIFNIKRITKYMQRLGEVNARI